MTQLEALPLDLVPPVGEDGLAGLAAALDEVVVDAGGAAVNDGFMESPQLALSHLLFANACLLYTSRCV